MTTQFAIVKMVCFHCKHDREMAIRYSESGINFDTSDDSKCPNCTKTDRNERYELYQRMNIKLQTSNLEYGWSAKAQKRIVEPKGRIKKLIEGELKRWNEGIMPNHDSFSVEVQPNHKRWRITQESGVICHDCKNIVSIEEGDMCPICGCDDYQKLDEKDLIEL